MLRNFLFVFFVIFAGMGTVSAKSAGEDPNYAPTPKLIEYLIARQWATGRAFHDASGWAGNVGGIHFEKSGSALIAVLHGHANARVAVTILPPGKNYRIRFQWNGPVRLEIKRNGCLYGIQDYIGYPGVGLTYCGVSIR